MTDGGAATAADAGETGGAKALEGPRGSRTLHWVAFFGIAATVIVADQLVKAWVVGSFHFGEPVEILGQWLRIWYIANSGALFGMFKDQAILFGILSLGVMVLIIWFHGRSMASSGWLATVALGLLLGGAVGNFVDRVRLGYVVDFVDMGIPGGWRFYTWNVADAAITTAILLLLLMVVLPPRRFGDPGRMTELRLVVPGGREWARRPVRGRPVGPLAEPRPAPHDGRARHRRRAAREGQHGGPTGHRAGHRRPTGGARRHRGRGDPARRRVRGRRRPRRRQAGRAGRPPEPRPLVGDARQRPARPRHRLRRDRRRRAAGNRPPSGSRHLRPADGGQDRRGSGEPHGPAQGTPGQEDVPRAGPGQRGVPPPGASRRRSGATRRTGCGWRSSPTAARR